MPVTLRDIAKQLNLSHATVSFVLNDRRDVAIPEATRQRVFQAAREMGYRPNMAARALVSGRTQILSVCVPQIRSPFYAHVFQTLVEACQSNGYQVLVSPSRPGVFRRAMDWPVDGVFVMDAPDVIASGDIPSHIPIISIGTDVRTETDHVSIDVEAGAAEAMRHLIETGAKNIVYLSADGSARRDARSEAYERAMTAAGLPLRAIDLPDTSAEAVRQFVRELAKEAIRPDGFFCRDDSMALATIRGMADAGFRCPEDFVVVGGDGSEPGAMAVPTLSSVDCPIQQMCTSALDLLMNRIKTPNMPVQSVELQATLIIRESSRVGVAAK